MEHFLGVMTNSSILVTAHQLEILFKKIKDNEIDFEKMKSFLENPKGTGTLIYPSYVRASKILGHDNVITVQTAYRLWGIPYSLEERHALDPIKYSEATLRECAAENKKGHASWDLIYIIGYSLVEQRRKLGVMPEHQPCFCDGYDWFLDEREKYWTEKKSESGYYLINFQDFGTRNLLYSDQLKKVEQLGPGYGVLDPQTFSESVITINKKKKTGIAEFWDHRPSMLTSAGDPISIGSFSEEGLKVAKCVSDWKYKSLRMVVYRKHDLQ